MQESTSTVEENKTLEETKQAIIELDHTIDKIDAALSAVTDLDSSDTELDELAKMATESFTDLIDLGMQVETRFSAEIFAVAGGMLGHALTAKTVKLNKKLKMIELQLKKAKFDHDKNDGELPAETGHGQILNRNDLLEKIIGIRKQKPAQA